MSNTRPPLHLYSQSVRREPGLEDTPPKRIFSLKDLRIFLGFQDRGNPGDKVSVGTHSEGVVGSVPGKQDGDNSERADRVWIGRGEDKH